VWRSRSAGVKVWRSRSADVKEWRCSITAAFLRRTLRRRSRGKSEWWIIFQSLEHESNFNKQQVKIISQYFRSHASLTPPRSHEHLILGILRLSRTYMGLVMLVCIPWQNHGHIWPWSADLQNNQQRPCLDRPQRKRNAMGRGHDHKELHHFGDFSKHMHICMVCAQMCVCTSNYLSIYTWSGQPCALDMWLTSLCFLFSGLLVTKGLTNKNPFIPLLFCTKHTHGRFSNTKSQGYHNLILSLSLSPFSSVSPAFHGWIAGYQRWVPALDLEIQLVARFSKCDDQLGLFQVLMRWDLGSDLDHPRCLR